MVCSTAIKSNHFKQCVQLKLTTKICGLVDIRVEIKDSGALCSIIFGGDQMEAFD